MTAEASKGIWHRPPKMTIDDLDAISAVVTQRTSSIFEAAMTQYRDHLAEAYEGKTILISGGADFIATQTIKEIIPFNPRMLIVVDSDENRMAELVRTLRSGGLIPPSVALEPRLVDITTPMVHRLVAEFPAVDLSLQFAAAKHVRTERDPISLLRLFQVNLLGTLALTEALSDRFPDCGHFVVSTDKAADPSSYMGASKRLMEMAVLGTYPRATTARFANVAFSNAQVPQWVVTLVPRFP